MILLHLILNPLPSVCWWFILLRHFVSCYCSNQRLLNGLSIPRQLSRPEAINAETLYQQIIYLTLQFRMVIFFKDNENHDILLLESSIKILWFDYWVFSKLFSEINSLIAQRRHLLFSMDESSHNYVREKRHLKVVIGRSQKGLKANERKSELHRTILISTVHDKTAIVLQ